MPTAADYAWFYDGGGAVGDSYCLTWVRALQSRELLTRAGVRDIHEFHGAAALVEPAFAAWDDYPAVGMLIAAIPLGEGTLAVEVNGYLGVTETVARTLSIGTELIAHYYSGGNGVSRFLWMRDGQTLVSFEPLFPNHREGTAPEAVLDLMRQVGFEFSDHPDYETYRPTAAAFALAETLADIRLTPACLVNSIYLAGLAPVPH